MIYGYIRVSTDMQTVENQKFELTRWAKRNNIHIDSWIEETISGAKDYKRRKLGALLKKVKEGDTILATEISRLGRSLLMVMEILNFCMNKGCKIKTIKDNYELGGDIQSKVLAFAFGLSAEIERKMIQQRTKQALDRKRAEGIKLGRPKGTTGKLKLLGKEEDIKKMIFKKHMNKTQIARKLKVNRGTVNSFIKNKMGIEGALPRCPNTPFKPTKIKETQIKEDYINGVSCEKIAQDLNVSSHTIRRYILKNTDDFCIKKEFLRRKFKIHGNAIKRETDAGVPVAVLAKKIKVTPGDIVAYLENNDTYN